MLVGVRKGVWHGNASQSAKARFETNWSKMLEPSGCKMALYGLILKDANVFY